ncbi:hypothetical protein LAZ67_5000740 [Cordylochernes scorpioides]|uniref:Kinesin motor domain-containing protein n=1 Tax=Cordylochernes scorpioides TaxID=51811 RepID=A0ABY6KI48_9ARAC|nr:hypothetical protein LAZ67_5000740 [Cordylochernes scorpioides]
MFKSSKFSSHIFCVISIIPKLTRLVAAIQEKVYKDLGCMVLGNAWEGYNATLFAYGQTGSGKSWSVVGIGPNKAAPNMEYRLILYPWIRSPYRLLLAGPAEPRFFSELLFLFIADRHSAYLFLVDIGAEVSVIPPPVNNARPSHMQLFAANGSLGLGRLFRWPFIIADVGVSIIGADFLRHYGLTVDLCNHRLSDPVSSLHSIGQVSPSPAVSIHLTIANSPYSRILRQFPELTSQNLVKSPPRHSVTHHIATNGPPIAAKPRRLPTDKLAAAKKEFAFMMEKGICRPSKSPWASPLHLVTKKDGSLRPCGDYRTECRYRPRPISSP